MERKSAAGSARLPSMMAYIILVLCLTMPAYGSVLNWRADGGTSTVIAPTAPPESSATSATVSTAGSVSGAASASAATTSTAATDSPDRPVLASGSTSTDSAATSTTGTATGSATLSAGNATATGNSSSPLNENDDPSGCHRDTETGKNGVINPFCDPKNGDSFSANSSIILNWDQSLFSVGSKVTIVLQHVTNISIPTSNDNATILSTTVDSALGHTAITSNSAMLNGTSNATFTLFLNTTINNQPKVFSGPLITVASNDSTSSSSDTTSSSKKKLSESVGIPVGLIFFLLILAGLAFLFFRHRRNSSAGYGMGKSLSQRTASTRGHTRGDSFHDEPTNGGVELQNRRGAGGGGPPGGENWDWGRDSIGSPVSPMGNQFRDELQRQQTGGRR